MTQERFDLLRELKNEFEQEVIKARDIRNPKFRYTPDHIDFDDKQVVVTGITEEEDDTIPIELLIDETKKEAWDNWWKEETPKRRKQLERENRLRANEETQQRQLYESLRQKYESA